MQIIKQYHIFALSTTRHRKCKRQLTDGQCKLLQNGDMKTMKGKKRYTFAEGLAIVDAMPGELGKKIRDEIISSFGWTTRQALHKSKNNCPMDEFQFAGLKRIFESYGVSDCPKLLE